MRDTPIRPADARAGLAGFAVVVLLAFDEGGYFARSWGWAALVLAGLSALALVLRERIEVSRVDRATVALLGALAGWTGLSAVWGIQGTEAAHEAARRSLPARARGAPARGRARHGARAPGRAAPGTVVIAVYALVDRVAGSPGLDPYEGALLHEPLGYANALGIVVALGLLVAAGLAAADRRLRIPAVGAAAPLAAASWRSPDAGTPPDGRTGDRTIAGPCPASSRPCSCSGCWPVRRPRLR